MEQYYYLPRRESRIFNDNEKIEQIRPITNQRRIHNPYYSPTQRLSTGVITKLGFKLNIFGYVLTRRLNLMCSTQLKRTAESLLDEKLRELIK